MQNRGKAMIVNTDRDRLAKTLKFAVLEQRPDYAEVRAVVEDAFLNGVDIAHGGFLFSLCDFACALASNTPERVAITSNSNIDFIGPVKPNETVLAFAELVAGNEKTGVYQVMITDLGQAKRYAVFRSRVVYKRAMQK